MGAEARWAVRDDRTLSCHAKVVWVMLESRGDVAHPSLPLLAADCGLSVRSVQRALRELEAGGWLRTMARARPNGSSTSSHYVVLTPSKATQSPPPRPGVTPPGVSVAPPEDLKIEVEKEKIDLVEEEQVSHPAQTSLDLAETVDSKKVEGVPVRMDVERVCRLLADKIEANGSKRPTITKAWRDAARLLMDRDGRTEQQVIGAIEWCQADDFWRCNILSMPTLRRQYDRLRLCAQRQQRRGTSAKVARTKNLAAMYNAGVLT